MNNSSLFYLVVVGGRRGGRDNDRKEWVKYGPCQGRLSYPLEFGKTNKQTKL